MKWKYETARFALADPKFEAKMNGLGAQGWELVGFEIEGANIFCIFKTPIP